MGRRARLFLRGPLEFGHGNRHQTPVAAYGNGATGSYAAGWRTWAGSARATSRIRGPGAGGPCYQWTRKVKGKTVSVALSKEQFEWLKTAIGQWRELQGALKEMQRLSARCCSRPCRTPHVVSDWAKSFGTM